MPEIDLGSKNPDLVYFGGSWSRCELSSHIEGLCSRLLYSIGGLTYGRCRGEVFHSLP